MTDDRFNGIGQDDDRREGLGGSAIYGFTKNGTDDSIIPNCPVYLFRVDTDPDTSLKTFVQVDQSESDAFGEYGFVVADPEAQYQVHAYLPGSPDLAGISLASLVAA